MGAVKEAMMDPTNHPEKVKRIYISKGKEVDFDTFVKEISLVLYKGLYDPNTVIKSLFSHMDVETDPAGDVLTIRAIIDEMILDGNQGSIEINDEIYSSYFEMIPEPVEPVIKSFKVSYDLFVPPLINFGNAQGKWKRVEVIMEGTRHSEVRRMFRENFARLNPDRKIKKIKVEFNLDDKEPPTRIWKTDDEKKSEDRPLVDRG